MLRELVDLFIAFLELMEAEVRSARRGIAVLGLALMLGLVATLAFFGAVGLLTWAFYLFLAVRMSPAGALAVSALPLLAVAGLSLCTVRKMLQ